MPEISESLLFELAWKHKLQQIHRCVLHGVSNCLAGNLALSELYCKNNQAESLQEALVMICDNCYKERDLLRLSSQLNHPQTDIPACVDVISFLKQIRPIFTCILPAQVSLNIDITALGNSFEIPFNPEILRRIFLQLVFNSSEALSQNTQPKLSILNAVEENLWVCKLIDNGIGIPEEMLKTIKNSFPLLLSNMDHLGMGLHMVHTYLKYAQGTLDISSSKCNGTTITMYLPKM